MSSTVISLASAVASNGSGARGRIDAIGVSQHAGGHQILHEVSVSIESGALVAVIGGSGAGKTTLLEVLAGVRPPSAGEIRHDGVPVDGAAVHGSGVGYVPQEDIIHLDMPLRRTLQYAARLRLPAGTSAVEADRIVDETLQDLDLADRGDVPVRQLSGGQRKRASIAVELLTRPRVFFLDEPTSGLDPARAQEVLALLRRLTQRRVTVVLTTHEPASIDRCDQVIVLAGDGHLAFTGSPEQARRYFDVDDVSDLMAGWPTTAHRPGGPSGSQLSASRPSSNHLVRIQAVGRKLQARSVSGGCLPDATPRSSSATGSPSRF